MALISDPSDRYAGGRGGNAEKSRVAMHRHYGPEKGEQVYRDWIGDRKYAGKGEGLYGALQDVLHKRRKTR